MTFADMMTKLTVERSIGAILLAMVCYSAEEYVKRLNAEHQSSLNKLEALLESKCWPSVAIWMKNCLLSNNQ